MKTRSDMAFISKVENGFKGGFATTVFVCLRSLCVVARESLKVKERLEPRKDSSYNVEKPDGEPGSSWLTGWTVNPYLKAYNHFTLKSGVLQISLLPAFSIVKE